MSNLFQMIIYNIYSKILSNNWKITVFKLYFVLRIFISIFFTMFLASVNCSVFLTCTIALKHYITKRIHDDISETEQ